METIKSMLTSTAQVEHELDIQIQSIMRFQSTFSNNKQPTSDPREYLEKTNKEQSDLIEKSKINNIKTRVFLRNHLKELESLKRFQLFNLSEEKDFYQNIQQISNNINRELKVILEYNMRFLTSNSNENDPEKIIKNLQSQIKKLSNNSSDNFNIGYVERKNKIQTTTKSDLSNQITNSIDQIENFILEKKCFSNTLNLKIKEAFDRIDMRMTNFEAKFSDRFFKNEEIRKDEIMNLEKQIEEKYKNHILKMDQKLEKNKILIKEIYKQLKSEQNSRSKIELKIKTTSKKIIDVSKNKINLMEKIYDKKTESLKIKIRLIFEKLEKVQNQVYEKKLFSDDQNFAQNNFSPKHQIFSLNQKKLSNFYAENKINKTPMSSKLTLFLENDKKLSALKFLKNELQQFRNGWEFCLKNVYSLKKEVLEKIYRLKSKKGQKQNDINFLQNSQKFIKKDFSDFLFPSRLEKLLSPLKNSSVPKLTYLNDYILEKSSFCSKKHSGQVFNLSKIGQKHKSIFSFKNYDILFYKKGQFEGKIHSFSNLDSEQVQKNFDRPETFNSDLICENNTKNDLNFKQSENHASRQMDNHNHRQNAETMEKQIKKLYSLLKTKLEIQKNEAIDTKSENVQSHKVLYSYDSFSDSRDSVLSQNVFKEKISVKNDDETTFKNITKMIHELCQNGDQMKSESFAKMGEISAVYQLKMKSIIEEKENIEKLLKADQKKKNTVINIFKDFCSLFLPKINHIFSTLNTKIDLIEKKLKNVGIEVKNQNGLNSKLIKFEEDFKIFCILILRSFEIVNFSFFKSDKEIQLNLENKDFIDNLMEMCDFKENNLKLKEITNDINLKSKDELFDVLKELMSKKNELNKEAQLRDNFVNEFDLMHDNFEKSLQQNLLFILQIKQKNESNDKISEDVLSNVTFSQKISLKNKEIVEFKGYFEKSSNGKKKADSFKNKEIVEFKKYFEKSSNVQKKSQNCLKSHEVFDLKNYFEKSSKIMKEKNIQTKAPIFELEEKNNKIAIIKATNIFSISIFSNFKKNIKRNSIIQTLPSNLISTKTLVHEKLHHQSEQKINKQKLETQKSGHFSKLKKNIPNKMQNQEIPDKNSSFKIINNQKQSPEKKINKTIEKPIPIFINQKTIINTTNFNEIDKKWIKRDLTIQSNILFFSQNLFKNDENLNDSILSNKNQNQKDLLSIEKISDQTKSKKQFYDFFLLVNKKMSLHSLTSYIEKDENPEKKRLSKKESKNFADLLKSESEKRSSLNFVLGDSNRLKNDFSFQNNSIQSESQKAEDIIQEKSFEIDENNRKNNFRVKNESSIVTDNVFELNPFIHENMLQLEVQNKKLKAKILKIQEGKLSFQTKLKNRFQLRFQRIKKLLEIQIEFLEEVFNGVLSIKLPELIKFIKLSFDEKKSIKEKIIAKIEALSISEDFKILKNIKIDHQKNDFRFNLFENKKQNQLNKRDISHFSVCFIGSMNENKTSEKNDKSEKMENLLKNKIYDISNPFHVFRRIKNEIKPKTMNYKQVLQFSQKKIQKQKLFSLKKIKIIENKKINKNEPLKICNLKNFIFNSDKKPQFQLKDEINPEKFLKMQKDFIISKISLKLKKILDLNHKNMSIQFEQISNKISFLHKKVENIDVILDEQQKSLTPNQSEPNLTQLLISKQDISINSSTYLLPEYLDMQSTYIKMIDIQSKLSVAEEKVNERELQISDIKNNKNNLLIEFENKMTHAANKIKNLLSINSQLEKEMATIKSKAKKDDLKIQLAESIKKCDELKNEISCLKEQYNSVKLDKDEIEKNFRNLNVQTSDLINEKKMLVKELEKTIFENININNNTQKGDKSVLLQKVGKMIEEKLTIQINEQSFKIVEIWVDQCIHQEKFALRMKQLLKDFMGDKFEKDKFEEYLQLAIVEWKSKFIS